jgi:hypothetical protein
VKISYWLLATSFWPIFSFGFVPLKLGMKDRVREEGIMAERGLWQRNQLPLKQSRKFWHGKI